MSETVTPEPAALERLLTPADVAELLGLRVQTLACWRCGRAGPAFIRAGSRVRYRMADVMAWLDRQTIAPAGGGDAAGGGR